MASKTENDGALRRYEVRLEAQDGSVQADGTPHFRTTTMYAESAEAAQAHCEQKEREVAAWQLPVERLDQILAEQAEAEKNGGELRGKSKGDLFAHNQTVPYAVVSVEEVER